LNTARFLHLLKPFTAILPEVQQPEKKASLFFSSVLSLEVLA
jgi:hypothetical protein